MIILIVEDNLPIQVSLEEMLGTHEVQCEFANTVEEATQQLEEFGDRLDMVITDYQLPDGVGVDVIQVVKGMQLRCQVIGMSGDPENWAAFLTAGAIGVLEKPFVEEECLSLIFSKS